MTWNIYLNKMCLGNTVAMELMLHKIMAEQFYDDFGIRQKAYSKTCIKMSLKNRQNEDLNAKW